MGVALRAFVHSGWFLSLVVIAICFQCFGASGGFCSSWGAFCFAVLVVLPLVLCFFLGAIVGNGSLMLVTAIGVCVLGCFSFFWWLSVGAWGAAARLGCSSSSLVWLRWRLSCGVCFFCALGLLLSLI